MMKIPLISRPSIIKVCFALVLSVAIVGVPDQAHASFFSGIISHVLGTSDNQAAQALPAADATTRNSQTIPLLESSINPDLKNMKDDSQPLAIVGDQALATETAPTGTDTIDKQYATSAVITTYTVKKGDTIDKLSKKFGVSKATLIQSNDFLNKKGTLAVGQVLTILPVDGMAYTVKKGDTVGSIAKKYSAATSEILAYNSLTQASDLKIGDTITIPGGQVPVAPVVAAKPVETAPIVLVKPVQKIAAQQTTPPAPVKVEVEAPVAAAQIQVAVPTGADGGDTSDSGGSTPDQNQNGASNGVAASGFIWPISLSAGRVSQGLHDDNAMDIAAPKGTPIYAPKGGTVLIAHPSGYNGGYGLYVVMNFDDGGQMLFGHMSKVASVAGDIKKQGDIIGYVGTTGSSTGFHVHVSARGIKNPYAILKVGDTSADFK
jgi:murein DD-endopeptidase MepM/ murein hydrolase activator NlpD